jgi:cell division protein ZipA
MDIKDWILILGGGLLLAVVGHGFWLAWRSRRDNLPLHIDNAVPKEEVSELELLRGELPNGGARVVDGSPPQQATLELNVPVLLEPDATVEPVISARREPAFRAEPEVRAEPAITQPVDRGEPVMIEEPDVAIVAESSDRPERVRENVAVTPGDRVERPSLRRRAAAPARVENPEPIPVEPPEEVIVINVLGRHGERFAGGGLLDVFLRNSLNFGDMNIFHRTDPLTKMNVFSVASAVEPGTFDMSDMDSFSTIGVSFFLQLPGPDEPMAVFDDMLEVARDVGASLAGDLKDENLSVMTGQTIEHCRQRINEFTRKRMSQRA